VCGDRVRSVVCLHSHPQELGQRGIQCPALHPHKRGYEPHRCGGRPAAPLCCRHQGTAVSSYIQTASVRTEALVDGRRRGVYVLQAGAGLVGSCLGSGPGAAQRFQMALEDSIARHFPGNHAINCMCHSSENFYRCEAYRIAGVVTLGQQAS
jgi:hypothetical protein